MKFKYIQNPLAFALGILAFAWAVGFARYFDHWVYFPAFPNVLDSIGLSIVGLFLLYQAVPKSSRLLQKSDRGPGPILSGLDDIDPQIRLRIPNLEADKSGRRGEGIQPERREPERDPDKGTSE